MNIDNFDWGVSASDDISRLLKQEIFVDRIYNKHFPINEGDIVVDVGASIGPFLYSIAQCKPLQMYALEPSKAEFKTLVKNMIGLPVCSINKAITDGDGITNALQDVYFWKDFVETTKFKTFRELYGIEKIDFLKTDCEGGEYHIFNEENIDFLVDNVRVVVGEWHLETTERKESFRRFRDVYLNRFKDFWVYSVDGVDIKWDLWNEHFLEYYEQVVIHIDNRK